jgi:pimeloyl-ACP methyl ester carboxylesterase
MQADEVRALGELAGQALGGAATRVEDMHEGIARRVFKSIGPAALPVRVIHDQVVRRAYATVRTSLASGARSGAYALSERTEPDSESIQATAAGRIAIGALNGAFGDMLVREGNALAVPMTIRRGGREVEPDRASLRDAFPHATSRVVVFLHGLCETDDAWMLGARRHVPYGIRLERELACTPVYVRYNSGRHISENGRDLADLLERLTAAWPVELHELVLIGHSMGGLVSRSACHYGATSDWVSKVRHVFTLGAPHGGAPLEQLANVASSAFALLPETRTFARALNVRSAGVKDLRYGYLCDEDWWDQDADAFLRNTGNDIPFTQTANHYFLCATVAREADSPSGRIVGDLLVLRASAWAQGGRGERMRFPVDNYWHIGGINHFDLLNHPAIYEQLRRRLIRKALPAPGETVT